MAEAKKTKGPRKMERHFKGVANHHRIHILLLVEKDEDITVEQLTERLRCGFRTASVHAQKLALAGLVEKRYRGREVTHRLTPYGRRFVEFITEFSRL